MWSKDRFSSASTTTWSTVGGIGHSSRRQPTARMLPSRPCPNLGVTAAAEFVPYLLSGW